MGGMDPVKRLGHWVVQYGFLAVFVIVILLGAFFFQRAQNDREALRQEIVTRQKFDDRRAYDQCLNANEVRKAFRDAILGNGDDIANALALAAAQGEDAPETAEERAELRNALLAFKVDLRQRSEKRLEPTLPRDCRELLVESQEEPP